LLAYFTCRHSRQAKGEAEKSDIKMSRAIFTEGESTDMNVWQKERSSGIEDSRSTYSDLLSMTCCLFQLCWNRQQATDSPSVKIALSSKDEATGKGKSKSRGTLKCLTFHLPLLISLVDTVDKQRFFCLWLSLIVTTSLRLQGEAVLTLRVKIRPIGHLLLLVVSSIFQLRWNKLEMTTSCLLALPAQARQLIPASPFACD
jgi:hypothetical protein